MTFTKDAKSSHQEKAHLTSTVPIISILLIKIHMISPFYIHVVQ